jgi:hypothetical protein
LTILHHRAGTCRLAGSRLAPAGTILETLLLHAVPDAGLGLHHAITVLQHLLLHHPLVEHLLLQHLLLHCSELTAVPVLAGPGNVSHALLATTTSGTRSEAVKELIFEGLLKSNMLGRFR